MELNAAAGRGEDPHAVLRRAHGRKPAPQPQLQPQPSSLSLRPHARDPGVGTGRRDGDGRARFSSSASQLRFAQGAEELRSVGQQQANWGRPEGIVPTGLAPGPGFGGGGGGSTGDETLAKSWGPKAGGAGRLSFVGNVRTSEACQEAEVVGFGAYGENAAGAQDHRRALPAWQQTSDQLAAGGRGRGGSRWGVFASGRAARGLERHLGLDKQVGGVARTCGVRLACLHTSPS